MESHKYVAIIDYGMGNLESISRACEYVGINSVITNDLNLIKESAGIILPGVGAFGEAMDRLTKSNLVNPLQSLAKTSKPFLGICLGYQLLMESSTEFGYNQGLGIIKGRTVSFKESTSYDKIAKVPQIGWNKLEETHGRGWESSLLEGLNDGCQMYFANSYIVIDVEEGAELATTCYGSTKFCSAIQKDNIFGIQCHPEKSGDVGLTVFKNLKKLIKD